MTSGRRANAASPPLLAGPPTLPPSPRGATACCDGKPRDAQMTARPQNPPKRPRTVEKSSDPHAAQEWLPSWGDGVRCAMVGVCWRGGASVAVMLLMVVLLLETWEECSHARVTFPGISNATKESKRSDSSCASPSSCRLCTFYKGRGLTFSFARVLVRPPLGAQAIHPVDRDDCKFCSSSSSAPSTV